jgi:hypothetical protein
MQQISVEPFSTFIVGNMSDSWLDKTEVDSIIIVREVAWTDGNNVKQKWIIIINIIPMFKFFKVFLLYYGW